jgi:hypothetical protein
MCRKYDEKIRKGTKGQGGLLRTSCYAFDNLKIDF